MGEDVVGSCDEAAAESVTCVALVEVDESKGGTGGRVRDTLRDCVGESGVGVLFAGSGAYGFTWSGPALRSQSGDGTFGVGNTS